jgi:uncharacterized membrane protein YGL010W
MDNGSELSLFQRFVDALVTVVVMTIAVGIILVVMGFILYFIGAADYYISFIKDLFSLIWNYLSIILTTTYLLWSLPKGNSKIEAETRSTPGCSFTIINSPYAKWRKLSI